VRVVLADYGAGNLRSVCSALERVGAEPVVSADPADVLDAPLAVVAGVGNAAAAAAELDARGLGEALRERVARDRPLFGICLGMQLLFEESDEGGRGLGLLRGRVVRIQARRVPHMGWNSLRLVGATRTLAGTDGADVYFAHSFGCAPAEPVAVAEVEHDGAVAAAVERGALAGVQFHPERSGPVGRRILANVVEWSRSA
jgi:glutamine amidotransferase